MIVSLKAKLLAGLHLLALTVSAAAAPKPGVPFTPAPVLFVACPDAPQFFAIAQSLPPGLWPPGAPWVITECEEAAWPATVAPYRAYGITTSNDGFMVYSTDPRAVRGIFIRRHAPDGTPPSSILCHELGHVVWPGLVDTTTHSLMDLTPLLRFFGGGTCEYILPGQSSLTEEAFAEAFAANRSDRATAGNNWGQQYIDSLFAPAPPSPPYIGKPVGGPILPIPPPE